MSDIRTPGRNVKVGEACRKLNPHIFGPGQSSIVKLNLPLGEGDKDALALKPKRFRQDSKPLLNGLEQEWFDYFQHISPDIKLRPQAKRYRLGNGKWYKPDFTGHIGPREMAWEVKGKKSFRDAMDTIKWAAHEWPEVTFMMVWKDADGRWQEQIALP